MTDHRRTPTRQPEDHPPFRYADYRSTLKRAPERDPITIIHTLSETTGPGPAWAEINEEDADLTLNAGTGHEAIGARTIVAGRVLDRQGNPVPATLIEVWQANAAGRYVHWREIDFPAPLDPNFLGVGQCKTNAEGEYRFLTVRPGPYPWGNHPKAWRPSHIHFSLLGSTLPARLVTQMYFPGDPLLAIDPIYQSAPAHSRQRMIAAFDPALTEENWALGYRFDIVLGGSSETPFEDREDH
jgi:protocatechuate 3,4-dioxygenase beta subunit